MSDIEHLKVNKIEPPPRETSRRLPVVMEPEEAPDVAEAYGGSEARAGESAEQPVDVEAVRAAVVEVLRSVYDPEIPVNIYDLGLIYGTEVDERGRVEIHMTLTAPGCPVAGSLVQEVADRVGGVSGVRQSHVVLVWDPPWTQDRMTEAAKLELGLF